MSIDEILHAIQGRKGTAKFNQACEELWKLAERADERNRPAREQTKAAEELARKNAKPGESITIDMTPDWRDVLHYFIQGVGSKKNPAELREKMTANLRKMMTYAQADEVAA
jgi:hypothetical protein